MIFNFDTDDPQAATAALMLYVVWRSRDIKRFKVSPEVWDQVTRFAKASAKRARTLPEFLDSLMPRLCCGSLKPKWMEVGYRGLTAIRGAGAATEFVQLADQREFMTGVFEGADHRAVLDLLYKQTSWIVLLVRDRLEREKPHESGLSDFIDDQGESL